MEINAHTKIDDLLTAYPFLLDFLVGKSPEFKKLKNPFLRKTIGKIATLERAAAMGKLNLDQLISELREEVKKNTGQFPEAGAPSASRSPEERRKVLKGLILDLHKGEDFQVVKKRFEELIKDVAPTEIAKMEQELVKEGLPETEIKRLCDVHAAIFAESLDRQEKITAPEGHPVHTFMLENRAAEEIMAQMDHLLQAMPQSPDSSTFSKKKDELGGLLERLSQIDIHYVRKENQLFPCMEAHGITAPPQVMWAVHDDIRGALKAARKELAEAQPRSSLAALTAVIGQIRDMIYKEENILFPMCMEVFSEADWIKVARGEEEAGYAWVRPARKWAGAAEAPVEPEPTKSSDVPTGFLKLDTGNLSLDHINLMVNHLPVDITFVNEDDRVAYFSQGKERIFPRSPGVIGREVQKCHPPDSVHIVNRILDEFKRGAKDVAEFWIQLKGRFIHIRYFAVRSSDGRYRGTLEVSQDVTEIRQLEGQRRLPDWD